MPPPVTADLRPCADGSAVHTALVSAGQLWPAGTDRRKDRGISDFLCYECQQRLIRRRTN